jgi:hypothetical protein
MAVRITGLKELTRQLDEAAEVTRLLDTELAEIVFYPTNPASVSRAIQEAEAVVDRRTRKYRRSPLVVNLALHLKQAYADQIRQRASLAADTSSDEH